MNQEDKEKPLGGNRPPASGEDCELLSAGHSTYITQSSSWRNWSSILLPKRDKGGLKVLVGFTAMVPPIAHSNAAILLTPGRNPS